MHIFYLLVFAPSAKTPSQPMVACLKHLQAKGCAIKLQLCDTWLREFQVGTNDALVYMFLCPSSFPRSWPSRLLDAIPTLIYIYIHNKRVAPL